MVLPSSLCALASGKAHRGASGVMSRSGLKSRLYLIPVNRFATSELPHFKKKIAEHVDILSKVGHFPAFGS